MINFQYKYLFSLLTCLIAFYSLKAQTGSVSGKIISDSNNAVPYQSVWIQGTSHGTFSNSKGLFQIKNIKPGDYVLVCAGLNIDSVEVPVSIKPGEDTYITVQTKETIREMGEVVITATRTEKELADVPMPVKIITGEQIRQMGSLRLNEVLMEQTGLAIVNDHGTGIQLQGFNPEYTLILLDGEPLIGRTAGTLDLTRLVVGNIKRIEIVKGPSSSLYGSEALAGVINIITETPDEKISGNLRARYGTNDNTDLTADANIRLGKAGIYVFANRYSSSGYDLTPASEDKTVPPFHNYTFQTKFTYKFSPRLNLSVSGRYFNEEQNSLYTFTESNTFYRIGEDGSQYDWNLNPVLTYWINDKNKINARFYSTAYHTNSVMTNVEDGSLYDESFFHQTFNRPEIQFDRIWNTRHQTSIGGGTLFESVYATRYTNRKYFYNIYAYAQHDVTILKRLNVLAGARFDGHSVYGSQLSPKLSAKLKLWEWLSVRGSIGRGFKAPDFRQLYLNFTNAVAGYSVFGSDELGYQLEQLQNQGQVSQLLIDPNSLEPIRAEYSTAYNIGWISKPFKDFTWQVNFFRNDINDMIASSPIAIKTNGQSVFSYFNISKVYTQGIETDFNYRFHRNFTLSAGYQYLQAKDKQVIKDLEKGTYYTRDPVTLATRRISPEEYGGLFNRSPHMATIKIFYMNAKHGWGGSVRAVYRGKYGFGDMNGNLILDQDNEYIEGYWLWNVAVSKSLLKNRFTAQAGVDNIFNYTQPQYIPSVPGRLYYVSLNVKLYKK